MKKVMAVVLSLMVLALAIVFIPGKAAASEPDQSGSAQSSEVSWSDAVAQAMSQFQDGGGYYTGTGHPTGFTQNTWEGMDKAFQLGPNDAKPTIDVSLARPSFCSSATYMLLLKSLSIWNDSRNTISREAWVNLKPYTLPSTDPTTGTVIPREDDGWGCWGRANANGPGLGVLVNELGAGKNYYVGNKTEYKSDSDYYAAWDQVKPGDFLKIFWNAGIGCDDNDPSGDEAGHMVLFLGRYQHYDSDGTRDDVVTWWSSNGSHTDINAGYGVESKNISDIYRAVATRITEPGNFNKAASIDRFNVNQWLSSLNGKHHATVAEMLANVGIATTTPPSSGTTSSTGSGASSSSNINSAASAVASNVSATADESGENPKTGDNRSAPIGAAVVVMMLPVLAAISYKLYRYRKTGHNETK